LAVDSFTIAQPKEELAALSDRLFTEKVG
jgi:hypothetical protein